MQNKTIKGYIEDFNFELDFRYFCKDLGGIVEHLSFAFIKIPIINKEHA